MSSKQTLSVVLPNYNHAKYLPEALEAILGQSRPPDEVIVIDDGSKDNSLDVLAEWAKKNPAVKVHVNEKNMGVVATLNEGVRLASSEYIYLAAADDRILPGFYEISMKMLAQYSEAGMSCGLSEHMTEDGRSMGLYDSLILSSRPVFYSKEKCRQLLLDYGSWFMCNASIYKKSALEASGLLRLELASYADGFCSEAIAVTTGVCFIPRPMAVWRRMIGGFSSEISRDNKKRIAILEKAAALMENEFANNFPPGYADLWKKRQLLLLIKERLAAGATSRDELRSLVDLIPHKTLSDRLFFHWMERYGVPGLWAIKIYAFFQKSFHQQMNYIRRPFFLAKVNRNVY